MSYAPVPLARNYALTGDYATEAPPAASTPCAADHPLYVEEKDVPKETGDAAAAPAAAPAADPLTSPETKKSPSAAAVPVMSDPLSLAAAEVTVDPLGAGDPLGGSVAAAAFSSVGSVLVGGTVDEDREQAAVVSRFLTWKQRRASILKQYVVTGQLKVQSELLNVDGVSAAALGSNIDDGPASGEKKVATTLDSKTRGRLEQLEATAEAKEAHTVRLTQQELVSRVDKLNGELRKAWEGEERVRALKIAIQVSKMLGDTAFPQFFPSVFVFVTEMLDNFGAAAQFGAIQWRDAQFCAHFSLTRPPPSRRRIGLRARPREGGGRQERLRRLHARADARGGRRDDEELVLQGGRNSGAILAQFWRNSGAIRRDSAPSRTPTRWRRSASSSPASTSSSRSSAATAC